MLATFLSPMMSCFNVELAIIGQLPISFRTELNMVSSGVLFLLLSFHFQDSFGFFGDERKDTYTRLGRLPIENLWGRKQGRRLGKLTSSSTCLVDYFDTDNSSIVTTRACSRKRFFRKPEVSESSSSQSSQSSDELTIQVSDPIIPLDVWETMTGNEFEETDAVDRLAQSGLQLAANEDENEWIEWTAQKDTEKALQEKDMMSALDDGKVLVYLGKAKKEGYGTQIPIIKSKSILPMSAQEMAELLMDSGRVQIYNKMSLGRKDVMNYGENTKIVRNLTKPPMAKSNMVSVTLMHSRELQESEKELLSGINKDREGYLVVSRAVPGMVDPEIANLTRNDIVLGVNLLQDLGPNECLMTAVTHVYSPLIPTMLARKAGVTSAINFVKDIRSVCEPVAN